MIALRWILGLLTVVGAAGWIVAGYQANKPCPQVQPQVIIREVVREIEPRVVKDTPVIDSLMEEGWEDEVNRQSDCLFEFIRAHVGHEITLDVVLAAGYWTDTLGGACLVIGEDDVQEED